MRNKLIKITEIEQQNLIAKQYQDEVMKIKQQELDEKNKQRERQAKYYKDLNSQLKEKRSKNTYSVLMSEYERSVNNSDIKAYQNMETENLHAMVPGFNSNNPQEKYIDKAMNIYTPQLQSEKFKNCICSPKLTNSRLDVSARGRNGKLKEAALRSFENFGEGKGIELKIHEENYTPAKIERVRQNMEKEDAIKYRANTNNRGYGFEQVSNKHIPTTVQNKVTSNFRIVNSKSANDLGSVNQHPYEYNFKAPGNY